MTPVEPTPWWPYVAAAAGAGFVAAASLTWASLRPENQLWGPVIGRAPATVGPRYALTFDDGPTPGATDRILDLLADLRAPAAFFVVGVNLRRAPDLVRRMHDEGHLVANHTLHHSHLSMFRGPRYWRREIDQTDSLIRDIIGHKPALFRPPMGMKTPFQHAACRRAGLSVVTWSRRGFDGVPTTTDRILQRLTPTVSPGDVVVLHDGVEPNRPRDPSVSVAAVRPLVDSLRQRGLEPMRLDQLLGLRAYDAA